MIYSKNKLVSSRDNIVTIEELPFENVYYPGEFGAFFGFSKYQNSSIIFCSCSMQAIKNYLEFRNLKNNGQAIPEKNFILDSQDFPMKIIYERIKNCFNSKDEIYNTLIFEPKLCHECNKKVPIYLYKLGDGSFRENFGWYINKQSYEFGVVPTLSMRGFKLNLALLPKEIKELIDYPDQEYSADYKKLSIKHDHIWVKIINDETWKYISEKSNDQMKRINRVIENIVRNKFGFKNIGDQWSSETLLFNIITDIFPNYKIMRNYRPYWLNRLEIDIYIEELKIACEYQGIQHFFPVKHWGGDNGLKKVKKRDLIKKEILNKMGIKLIYFNYDEGLSKSIVQKKLTD